MYSELDNRGNLCVDCVECERGRNGSGSNRCASGYRFKRPNLGSCFNGELMPKYLRELYYAQKVLKENNLKT